MFFTPSRTKGSSSLKTPVAAAVAEHLIVSNTPPRPCLRPPLPLLPLPLPLPPPRVPLFPDSASDGDDGDDDAFGRENSDGPAPHPRRKRTGDQWLPPLARLPLLPPPAAKRWWSAWSTEPFVIGGGENASDAAGFPARKARIANTALAPVKAVGLTGCGICSRGREAGGGRGGGLLGSYVS